MQHQSASIDARTLRKAVLLALFGEAVLTLMDAIIKVFTTRYPTFEIVFLRFLSGSIFAILLYAVARPPRPSRPAVIANAWRSLLIVTSGTSFFFGLSRLPLADALALSFLAPTFMALFGMLLLGEPVDRRIWAALAAGFGGMLLIVAGEAGQGTYTGDALLGAAACFLSAVVYALSTVLLRVRAQQDPLPLILLFQNTLPAVMLAFPAYLVWVPPARDDLLLFLFVGAIGVAGHLALASAFSRVAAARLAPVHYSTLAWGLLFGYIAFGHIPGLTTFAGAGLIVAATLIAQRR